MKIMIVEDDPSLQKLLELFLADYGACDKAANGREALEAIQRAIDDQQPYDLVCMDVMMPEMDGLEALRKIRQLEFKHHQDKVPSVKVIMITAKDLAKDMMSAFHAGCEAYITKPVSRKKLLDQIRQLGLLDAPAANENAAPQ